MRERLSYLVYDLEIIKAIPDKREPPIPGIEYCAGWHDHANMGISVIGCYSSIDDRYRVFCQDNFDDFLVLAGKTDLAVTFNGINFDNKVLAENCLFEPLDLEQYDCLQEIWRAAMLGPEFYCKTHGGFGLDAVCRANGIASKTGNGAQAPIDWQLGRLGKVIDYCLNDVRITNLLFKKMINGSIINPKTGTPLSVKMVSI